LDISVFGVILPSTMATAAVEAGIRPMATPSFQTPEEIQTDLGQRLRQLRLGQRLTQAGLASRAGVSPRALRGLESGEGSSLITVIRVLKALGALTSLDALAPQPTISPMALLAGNRARKRGTRH
jgi:DNA-binding XRE family transcriptional regulator